MKGVKKFFNSYRSFIDKLLMKGHVQVHHFKVELGRYHMRGYITRANVNFSCLSLSLSVQRDFRNDHLLSGPDLENQLFGVLDRFMLEPVSFTTGIQVLFYQIRVSEHERLFFLFL